MTIKASTSVSIPAASSGAIYAQMLADATRPISIRTITIVPRTNVPLEIGLVRAFAVGTAGATTVATGIAHRHPNQANMAGKVEYGWSTSPTCGATGANGFFRREIATGTRLLLWRLEDEPIVVEPTGVGTGSAGLLLMNVGSAPGPALDVHVTWEYGPAADR